MRRRALPAALLGLLGTAAPLSAQVEWRDLVVTGGFAVETYRGNLLDVNTPLVDSTDRADAAVGQVGAAGTLLFFSRRRSSLSVSFDLGLKQFAAGGFEFRDYAPRELVGLADLRYRTRIDGLGVLHLDGRFKGRGVADRPPMPLYLEPGYAGAGASARLQLRPVGGFRVDAGLSGEFMDYTPPEIAPHLDLLDRRSISVEAGAERDVAGGQSVRLYGGLSASRYPEQGSFDPADPHRRDQALRAGARWSVHGPLFLSLGLEGTLNRSNSRRPEYNLLSASTLLAAPLPADFNVQVYGVLTDKSYIHESEFARLVPGEEADNASVVYLSFSRPLTEAMDGALRFGWTRAEGEIGEAYFQRYGAAFFLHYRLGRP